MRFFVPLLRLRGAVLFCLIWSFWAVPAAQAEVTQVPIEDARRIAVQAALAGDLAIAIPLARGLLEHDPNDPYAHLAMTAIAVAVGDWAEGYRLGQRSFKLAETQEAKYNAARLTATAAIAQDKVIATQFWLRRAGDTAPRDVDRAKVARNYQVLRRNTPFSYRFDASVAPSSNVNGGADSPYNIIDGVPLVGILSNDARALSGWVAQSNLNLSFRIDQSDRSRTNLSFGAYTKRVRLSDEARAFAPTFDAEMLNATSLSLSLSHVRNVGGNGATVGATLGWRETWRGGDRANSTVSTGFSFGQKLSDNLYLRASLGYEALFYVDGSKGENRTAQVSLSRSFTGGGRLTGTIKIAESEADNSVFDNDSIAGKLTWSLGKPVKSVKLATSVGASLTDYQNYSLGFIPVPGGRQDEGLFAEVDATFTQIEFAGFSPKLRVRRQTTSSNVSRFDTAEWAVSLGIQSNF